MTNEQLYVLLEWLADGLEDEIGDVRQSLIETEGIERRANLYRDGEYVGRAVDRVPLEHWRDEEGDGLERWAIEHGYEVRHDGDPVILGGLFRLLRKVRERSRALR